MAFLGLISSENSSGDKRVDGGITKAGNCWNKAIMRYYVQAKNHNDKKELQTSRSLSLVKLMSARR